MLDIYFDGELIADVGYFILKDTQTEWDRKEAAS